MSVRVLDAQKRIIEIIWKGIVTSEHVEQANKDLEAIVRSMGSPFDVLVDMRELKAFPQDTKEKLVEHQKLAARLGMKRASVVTTGAIAKIQLKKLAQESNHQTEFQFPTYEEALNFLKNN